MNVGKYLRGEDRQVGIMRNITEGIKPNFDQGYAKAHGHSTVSKTNQYALGYKAGLEAAVKVCDELYKHDRQLCGYDEGWNYALDIAEQAIANLPLAEPQWQDLTTEELESIGSGFMTQDEYAHAIIIKFKEKNSV